jgi:hypothetical protein
MAEHLRRAAGRLVVTAVAVAAFAGWAAVHPSLASASSPPVTTSIYVTTESASTMETWGCTQGGSGKSGLIILDFGRPAYRSSDNAYGTINFDGTNGKFLPNGTIQTMMQQFAFGWWSCSGVNPQVTLAWGTNNCAQDSTDSNCPALASCPNGSSPCAPSFSTAGQKWGAFVTSFAGYLINQGFSSQESAAAGDDAEPAYNPGYSQSRNFVGSYNSSSDYLIYDYGAAYSGPWTDSDIYFMSYGALNSLPVPEVYTGSTGPPPTSPQANEWEGVAKWGYSNGTYGAPYFEGVMCVIGSGYLPCDPAWNAMLNALQSSSETTQSTIPYLTHIQFGG